MSVGTRFDAFLGNLTLTQSQRDDGIVKHTGVRSCLNQYYYGVSSGYSNSILAGSWGKSTEIRPPRDIDVIFELPKSVYDRFEQRPWGTNKQSALLQEPKCSVLNAEDSWISIQQSIQQWHAIHARHVDFVRDEGNMGQNQILHRTVAPCRVNVR